MNYEQQYPEVENIIDWNKPVEEPKDDFELKLDPSFAVGAGGQGITSLANFALGNWADQYQTKRKQKLPGLDDKSDSYRLRFFLPNSKQFIQNDFNHVPTYGELEDMARYGDKKKSNQLGILHPEVSAQLDRAPFAVGPFVNSVPKETVWRKGNAGTTDTALAYLANLFEVKDPNQLRDLNSPDSKRVRKMLGEYIQKPQGPVWGYPNEWKMGDLSRDNLINFTMNEIESPKGKAEGNDKGGMTKYGIAANSERDRQYLKGKGSYAEQVDALTADEARNIHIKEYWNKPFGGLPAPKDVPNPRLAYAVYETSLNSNAEARKSALQILKNSKLTDDQKADQIFTTRRQAFINGGFDVNGLTSRVDKSQKFLRYSNQNILWSRVKK